MLGNHCMGKLKGSSLAILLLVISVLITGCDNNNDNSNENGSINAVLSVRESRNVPGRIELDPRGSKPGAGQKLESHTIEVIDVETGETVFGPVTESAASDSALKKAYFPSGDYLAILTVTANTIPSDEVTAARAAEGKTTDTTNESFSIDSNVTFPEADTCQATCSTSASSPGQTTCTLPTDCITLDLEADVLNQA